MLPRIAGIFSARPEAVTGFLRLATDRFATHSPGVSQVLAFPQDQPIVGVVVAEGRRPAIRFWRGPDGSFVVLDGEVYDFGEGAPLELADIPSGAHAERLFRIYRRHGAAGLARVDAAAAMVIFDAGRRELCVFRDASGVVTTFHAMLNGDVIFASQTAMLLAAGVPKRIDRQTVDYYLSKGYAPAPWTFIEGIRKVPPGHVLTAGSGVAPTVIRYFRQVTQPKRHIGRDERNKQLGSVLTEAIRRRCDPNRTTSVLLSGGIDSMLILGSLVKLVGGQAEAFTFRYADYDGRFNEEEPARRLAAHLGIKHEIIPYGPTDIVENLQKILQEYGEPLAWGLHSFMLRHMARPGVETIITGTEPEYNLRNVDIAAIRFRQLPAAVRCMLRAGWQVAQPALPRYARAAKAILRSERTGLPPQFVHSSILGEESRRAIYLNPDWARAGARASEKLFLGALDEVRDEDPYDQARLLDDRYLNSEGSLFWTSVWARSYDLTIRHPYCDRDVRDFFYKLPADQPAKSHLREFAATFLPHEFAYAPKSPQEIPIGHWFRGPLRDTVRERLAPDNLPAGLFQAAVVQRLVTDHLEGKADNTWRIWALMSLSTWASMLGL